MTVTDWLSSHLFCYYVTDDSVHRWVIWAAIWTVI